ncbi:hypothetical protein AN641_09555 [Candidatus Epulonipiscioides gigas]|nr:hypothetical protein AN641_09555 [Epulopiscium sp. SCG-C07WGA-EpuloA2]
MFKKYFAIMSLSILSTAIPTLADTAVTDEEILSHSFKTISFEEGEAPIKITASTGVWGSVHHEFSNDYATDGEVSLKVRYEEGSSANVTLAPADGSKWDFSDDRMILAYDVTNPVAEAGRLVTTFKYDGGSISYQQNIEGNTTKTVYCVLDKEQYSLGADMLPSPVGENGMVMGSGWGGANFDPSTISSISLRYSLDGVGYYIFDNFRVVPNPLLNPENVYSNIVDKFGQYTKADWPTKTHSEEEMHERFALEDAQNAIWVEESLARKDRSKYGGYKNEDLRQESTGQFYTTKIDGKWTLIDPDGYPFFSTGFGIVRLDGMSTWISGREYMYEELPAKDGELGDHYDRLQNTLSPPSGVKAGDGFPFYEANLERRYGDNWLEEWGKNATTRFEAWGLTSIGAWAEPKLFFGKGSEHKTPYTAFTWTTVSSGKHIRLYDSVPDPFDPEFEKSTRAALNSQAVKYNINKDPYCFGLFVDNEFKWGTSMTNNSLIKAVLDDDIANEKSYAKKHFLTVLQDKYDTIEDLNRAWETNIASFNELGKSYTGKISAEDGGVLIYEIANKYYKTVHDVMDELLPGTLYLGSRNTEFGTPTEVIKAAIQYVDILSFNNYNEDVQREKFRVEEYDMPMIIGEFNFTGTDSGLFAASGVGTQPERAEGYINYVENALKSGNFVGVHWFQYYDQPILGRSWDGENYNAGFVDVVDMPYPELIEASRYVYDTMYETKFNHVPMTNIDVKNPHINMDLGTTAQIEAITTPLNLNDDINYYTSNAYVATVDKNGVVSGVSEGEATITVKNANDLFVVTSVNVTVGENIEQTALAFDDNAKEIVTTIGATIDLSKYLELNAIEKSELEWKSSEKFIATVDQSGVVTAHSSGRVTIVVKDKNGYVTDSVNLVIQ